MKTSLLFPSSAMLALAGLVSMASSHAAPLAVTDATYTGSVIAGTPEAITGNATLASLTTSEGTFSILTGATANNVVTSNVLSSIGTAPANANAAVTGLSANDGVNNLQSGNFQFGLGTGGFTLDTRFFIIESTPQSATAGDPAEIRLLDASNNVVGSFLLSLTAANFTNTPANTTNTSLATVTYTAGQGNLVQKLGGVTFSLSDLGVTNIASVSTATGIRIVSPGAVGGAAILDPNVVGLYTVPEPGTCLLMGVGLGCVLLGRRQRQPRA
jgi:hypothetical protein